MADDPGTVSCTRCGREDAPAMTRPPFRNELGERLLAQICSDCWSDWLEHQTLLINHYGLDPREAKAREFLYSQIEEVLLGGGLGANPAGGEAPEPEGKIPED